MIEEYHFCAPETEDHWNQMLDLRYEVLRKPWNEPRGSEKANDDDQSLHFIILSNENIVLGCCRCHFISETEAQLRFMAINPDYQRQKLGNQLVNHIEHSVKEAHPAIRKIILHARETAVPFYIAMGYDIIEESYLLFGVIQHYLMEKKI